MTHSSIRLLSLLLTLALLLGVCVLPASAAQAQSSVLVGRSVLTDNEKIVYDYLKENIDLVAAGTLTSSVFTLYGPTLQDWQKQGFKITWTNADFGSETISDVSLVYKAFFNQFDLTRIVEALLQDCPYSLYWFDKTAGVSYSYSSTGKQSGKNIVECTISSLSFTFRASSRYQSGDGESAATTLDPDDVKFANTAEANAQSYAKSNQDQSDYDKLAAYRDTICGLTAYDTAAKNSGSYGDSWQLTNVFDGDSSTNVVCEGYTKAFQHLCNLSEFENARCYSVSGYLTTDNGNAEAHMWNLVVMEDGASYLVDLTNSDDGTPGGLFLVGGTGSVDDGFTVTAANGSKLHYTYSDSCKNLWGTGESSILNLSAHDYQGKISGKISDDGNQVTVSVPSGGFAQEALLITAFYQNGAMVKSTVMKTVASTTKYTISAPSKTWDTCKLFLLQKGTYAPLCENIVLTK